MRVRGLVATLTVLVLATSMLVVPGLNAVQPAKAGVSEWRYLVYLIADNNLDTNAGQFNIPVVEDDFRELMSVGSSDLVQCYVFVDRLEGPANLFKILKGSMDEIMSFDLNDKEVNMGDPAVLRAFVEFVYDAAPAEHTVLMFWDHGCAEYAGWDDNALGPGIPDMLTHYEVMEALKGYKVDVMGFDECLVGQIEVCYEYVMNDVQVDYFLASETYTGWRGYPYDWTLGELVDHPDMTPRECAIMFIEQTDLLLNQPPYQAEIVTDHAAIDMGKMKELVGSFHSLASMITPDMKSFVRAISMARGAATFSYGANAIDIIDFGTFVDTLGKYAKLLDVKQACVDVMSIFNDTILATQLTQAVDHHLTGLGLLFPQHNAEIDDYYLGYHFMDEEWMAFLEAFWNKG